MELDQDMYDDNYDGTVKPDHAEVPAAAEAAAVDEVQDRDNALHLRGTDDMSTSDVHKYLGLYTKDSKPRIEWIDDTSLNLVYYTAEDAKIALAHLTQVPTDVIDSKALHSAQSNPEKPEARLTIRIATTADKKEKGAKDRSRWYLFHPEDDPDSRPRGSGRRRGANRDHEPYSRTGRHERRIAAGTAGSEDLFASKVLYDASHLPPAKIKPDLFDQGGESKTTKTLQGEDLFTSRLTEAAKVSLKQDKRATKTDSRKALPASDLFARLSTTTNEQVRGQDLFADRLGSGSLADRISGGPIRTRGLNIKGASKRAKASDLF